jgi:hypothetical protein
MPPRACRTRRSRCVSIAIPRSSASGEGASVSRASKGCRTGRARVARAVFPPEQVAEVVAVACELPARHGRPLGRFSRAELHQLVLERAICEASATTVWRWLHDAALKPWQQRSWIFPRDPAFVAAKAGVVLGSLWAPVRRQPAASGRLRHLRGREVPTASAWAPPRDDRGRAGPSGAGRVRVPPRRHAGLPGGLGRPPRAPV